MVEPNPIEPSKQALPESLQKIIDFARMRPGQTAIVMTVFTLLFYRLTLLLPTHSTVLVIVSTLLSIPLLIALCVSLSRCMRTHTHLIVHLCLSLIGMTPQFLRVVAGLVPLPALKLISPILKIYYAGERSAPGLRGIIMIWFATALGVLISRVVKELKLLLPMGITLALMDLYVVFGGGLVTQATSGSNPGAAKLMNAMTVNLPKVAPKGGAAPLQLAIGFADFLFIALFFACFHRFKVPSTRTFLMLCGLLVVYMGVVAIFGTPLPALVPIAAVVIGMNLKRFKYERQEAFAMFYAGLILLGVLGFMMFKSRAH